MASELITLDLDGIQNVRENMKELIERAKDLSPVWEFMGEAFRREMDEQFKTQGKHLNGVEWQALSPNYAKVKERKLMKMYGTRKPPDPFGILYMTGDLYRSLAQKGDENALQVIKPTYALYGTRVPYGKHHQTGGKRLPQRKIMKARDTFRALLQDATVLYLLRGELPGGTR